MNFIARHRPVVIASVLLVAVTATAQQPAPLQQGVPQQGAPQQQNLGQPQGIGQQPGLGQQPQQPIVPQVPPGFQLNALEQTALDTLLDAWQKESATITTFKCSFERWEYNVFGPNNNKDPLNKNSGELSYHRPDKGSFQIIEVKTFTEMPVPPGSPRKGDWVKRPDAIGDHWVCDGKSVYQYRPDVKQLVEHPIPPQLQGQAIVDGPLPFLFGADAVKLKERYWMRIDQQQNQDPNQIWLIALPRFQAQAADFRKVEVILDRKRLLPRYMNVWKPNGERDLYMFDLDNASKNSALDRFKDMFDRPRVPLGWKRVVENMPLQQAAQPVQPLRKR
jgi:TIGR03009 family protein